MNLLLQGIALLVLSTEVPPAPPEDDTPVVSRLIEQLGSPKYAEREAATKKLEEIGEPALPGLRKTAAGGKTLEIKRRAERAVAAIEDRSFRELWHAPCHEGLINRVSLSPDGQLGLSAGDDNRVFLWKVASGKTFAQVEGTKAAFTSDGSYVLTDCPGQKKLQLWSVTQKKYVPCPLNHERFPRALSRDGRLLFGPRRDEWAELALGSGPLRLLDISGKESLRLETGDMRLGPVALSSDDRYLLVGGGRQGENALLRPGALLLADMRTGQILWRVDAFPFFISGVAFAPDGKTALVAGKGPSQTRLDIKHPDAFLQSIDVEKGKMRTFLRPPPGGVSHFAYCCGGRRAILVGEDGTLQLWDLDEGRPLFSRLANRMAPINCLGVAADGRSAVTGDVEGTIRLWHLPK